MKVAFLHSDKPRERILADAFLGGARKHGHETAAVALGTVVPGTFDVVAMVGVKSRELFKAQHRAGARIVYLDKGYCRQKSTGPSRGWEYWRVAVDAHQPTERLNRERPGDRWNQLGLEMQPWRTGGDHILLAGSSAKYHAFYGMKEPTAYMKGVVRELRGLTPRELVYRPKPSWSEAVPLPKTRFSQLPETIFDVLDGAWATVTHGSNACFESVLGGVPCVILGDAVARPLSSTELDEIEHPRLASDDERLRWAHNLAFWQWTASEFASGKAWDFIGEEIHAE